MEGINTVLDMLNSLHPVSEKLRNLLSAHFKTGNVPKKKIILAPGDDEHYYYFLLKGMARAYFMQDEIVNTTRFIYCGNGFSRVINFYKLKYNTEYIETLEPCVLAGIDYREFVRIAVECPELNYMSGELLQDYIMRTQTRHEIICLADLKERVLKFKNLYPDLVYQASSGVVASYLNIGKSTFHRLKKIV
jgi:CRP/FNR family transcriptional regulator, anaerobic regulatory protein